MREGYFWDVMEDRRPPPPAAALLGFELLAIDECAGHDPRALPGAPRVREPDRRRAGRLPRRDARRHARPRAPVHARTRPVRADARAQGQLHREARGRADRGRPCRRARRLDRVPRRASCAPEDGELVATATATARIVATRAMASRRARTCRAMTAARSRRRRSLPGVRRRRISPLAALEAQPARADDGAARRRARRADRAAPSPTACARRSSTVRSRAKRACPATAGTGARRAIPRRSSP